MKKPTKYQRRVIELLAETFEWDRLTIAVAEKNIAIGNKPVPPYFEFICDDPVAANWRLKRSLSNPKAFRLSDYRLPVEASGVIERITRERPKPDHIDRCCAELNALAGGADV